MISHLIAAWFYTSLAGTFLVWAAVMISGLRKLE